MTPEEIKAKFDLFLTFTRPKLIEYDMKSPSYNWDVVDCDDEQFYNITNPRLVKPKCNTRVRTCPHCDNSESGGLMVRNVKTGYQYCGNCKQGVKKSQMIYEVIWPK